MQMAEYSHLRLRMSWMVSPSGKRSANSTTDWSAKGRKTKVEYLIAFLGYGPKHKLWQDDVENCQRLVRGLLGYQASL